MYTFSYHSLPDETATDNLLFEPADAPLSLFSCLADHTLSHVLACNDTDQPVHILKGFKLGHLLELEENQYCLQVVPNNIPEVLPLALRSPKSPYLQQPPTQPPETTHHTGVTIYGNDDTVAAFSDLLDEFPDTL
jgi:hypothetical protein